MKEGRSSDAVRGLALFLLPHYLIGFALAHGATGSNAVGVLVALATPLASLALLALVHLLPSPHRLA